MSWLASLGAAAGLWVLGLLLWNLARIAFWPEAWKEAVGGEGPAREAGKKHVEECAASLVSHLKSKFRVVCVSEASSPSGKKWKFQMRVGLAWNTLLESWNEAYFKEALEPLLEEVVAKPLQETVAQF